mmetsp:Transcript_54488/g.108181  ORF Transcript_54488/g.108181 Transcript_54488/m.108181 type:complete len:208 (-) Transcript_54488:2135-2758(-)
MQPHGLPVWPQLLLALPLAAVREVRLPAIRWTAHARSQGATLLRGLASLDPVRCRRRRPAAPLLHPARWSEPAECRAHMARCHGLRGCGTLFIAPRAALDRPALPRLPSPPHGAPCDGGLPAPRLQALCPSPTGPLLWRLRIALPPDAPPSPRSLPDAAPYPRPHPPPSAWAAPRVDNLPSDDGPPDGRDPSRGARLRACSGRPRHP